ncbi:MAG: hypothetical protein IJV31_11810 [Clostridia bacterium]|nr:hypothetical protein [Clostridia bacterium]
MKNIIEKCKTTRILAAIGIIALFLGTILPYLKYNIYGYKYTITLYGYWAGKVVILLAVANLLFIFKDIIEKYVPFLFDTGMGRKIQELDNAKYSLVPTVLIAIFAIYETVQLGTQQFKYYNIGFYSLWIGVIALVAYAIVHKKDEYNYKG